VSITVSKPGIKLFRSTSLEELEEMVNDFCNDKWVYDIKLQVHGEETTCIVVYLRVKEGGKQ